MPNNKHSAHSPEKLAFWRAKIEEQQVSGLSQAEFCRQNNLREKAFSFWKREVFPEQKISVQKQTRSLRRRVKVVSPFERNRLLKKWQASGLTQAEFCRRENILEWQFSNWKIQAIKEKAKGEASKQPDKTGFVEIKAEKSKPASSNSTVSARSRVIAEVHFSGALISILAEAEMSDIKKIITALTECGHAWAK